MPGAPNVCPVTEAGRVLTIAATMERLQCSRRTVYRLIDDETLRRVYIRPGAPRVVEEDVEALVTPGASAA